MRDYNDCHEANNADNNNDQTTRNATITNNINEASNSASERTENDKEELTVTPAISIPTTPITPTKPLKSILRLNTHLGVSGATPTPTPLILTMPQKPIKPAKKKRVDRNDLGDDFIAPDGGWGWVVAVASGLNILVTFALAQQFGIVFRDHMTNLGVTSSKLTTIINIQVAVSAFSGLLNGPLFRNFTYRQVALVGSVLTFLGLFMLVFAGSFTVFIFSFSILYAFGRGLTTSASSLAVNTYFKVKRRNATAYQFTVAGLGPIFYPYLATFLMQYYGVRGTVAVFAALAANTLACSLIYQPVMWHVKPNKPEVEKRPKTPEIEEEHICEPCEPDTPVLPRANDGWYGSRNSLNTAGYRNRFNYKDRSSYGTELRLLSTAQSPNFSKSPSIREESDDDEFEYDMAKPTRLPEGVPFQIPKEKVELHELEDEDRKKLPFYKKVIIFFDLDLLRDVTYVNLAVGLMLINFVEINFAILTPFILAEFGFENNEIAFAMSSLGFCDLVLRLAIPLITAKMQQVSNKVFFALGILGMCVGRFVLAFTRNFYVLVGVFVFLGLFKAFRTVFWTLIIPSYVPLKRLPAASGLQLLMSGTFAMACGPLIGLIQDSTNYVVTLIVLNLICLLALLMWLIEALVRRSRENQGKKLSTLNDIKS